MSRVVPVLVDAPDDVEDRLGQHDCRVLKGKQGVVGISLEQAAAEGPEACRVCEPPAYEQEPAAGGEGVISGTGTPGP